jgi:hypothetical protein
MSAFGGKANLTVSERHVWFDPYVCPVLTHYGHLIGVEFLRVSNLAALRKAD